MDPRAGLYTLDKGIISSPCRKLTYFFGRPARSQFTKATALQTKKSIIETKEFPEEFMTLASQYRPAISSASSFTPHSMMPSTVQVWHDISVLHNMT